MTGLPHRDPITTESVPEVDKNFPLRRAGSGNLGPIYARTGDLPEKGTHKAWVSGGTEDVYMPTTAGLRDMLLHILDLIRNVDREFLNPAVGRREYIGDVLTTLVLKRQLINEIRRLFENYSPVSDRPAWGIGLKQDVGKLLEKAREENWDGEGAVALSPVSDRPAWGIGLKQDVGKLLEKAREENWDGEGAVALSPHTVEIAQQLIDKFPSYIAEPDVSASPHGEIDFDWANSQNAMLTVSVEPSGKIAFAFLSGNTRVRGSEEWKRVLPKFMECAFREIMNAMGK